MRDSLEQFTLKFNSTMLTVGQLKLEPLEDAVPPGFATPENDSREQV